LQPPDRFTALSRGWAECIGGRFGFVVGSMSERGYRFSASEILHTTDLMLRALEAYDRRSIKKYDKINH
jgi:hypothetical protein